MPQPTAATRSPDRGSVVAASGAAAAALRLCGTLDWGRFVERVSLVEEALRSARAYLEGKGVPSSKLDAEYLLAHVLAIPRLELYLDHDRPLEPAEGLRYRGLGKARVASDLRARYRTHLADELEHPALVDGPQ